MQQLQYLSRYPDKVRKEQYRNKLAAITNHNRRINSKTKTMQHLITTKDGKCYPIKFSQGVIMRLAVKEGVPSNQLQKFLSGFASWPIGRMFSFYWLAFKAGSDSFDMSEDDFIDLISEDDTILPQIMNVQAASEPEPVKKNMAKGSRRS